MRADPDDIIVRDVQRSRFPIVELLLALAVIAGLVVFWFWSEDKKPAEKIIATTPVVTPAQPLELPPTPDIPEREEAVTATVTDSTAEATADGSEVLPEAVENASPPTPVDGDTALRQQLSAIGANALLGRLANSEHPLDVSAALVDALGRGIILRKMLPAEPLKQPFSVERDGGALYMSPASYNRYNAFTDAIASLDISALVESFHKMRPFYKGAYEELGLDPNDFDNAIIRTLDMILATPEISGPIALNTKSVIYVYADPALESLPAVQKQLLRMGPDNLRRIKQQARMLREGLLAH